MERYATFTAGVQSSSVSASSSTGFALHVGVPNEGHSRHSRHPGMSGSPQERTFGDVLTLHHPLQPIGGQRPFAGNRELSVGHRIAPVPDAQHEQRARGEQDERVWVSMMHQHQFVSTAARGRPTIF